MIVSLPHIKALGISLTDAYWTDDLTASTMETTAKLVDIIG